MFLNKEIIQANRDYLIQFKQSFNRHKYLKIVHASTDNELRLLIKLVHSVTKGDIHCPRQNYLELKRKKVLPYLNLHFRTLEDTNKILSLHRKEQLAYILKILSSLHDILASLFMKRK